MFSVCVRMFSNGVVMVALSYLPPFYSSNSGKSSITFLHNSKSFYDGRQQEIQPLNSGQQKGKAMGSPLPTAINLRSPNVTKEAPSETMAEAAVQKSMGIDRRLKSLKENPKQLKAALAWLDHYDAHFSFDSYVSLLRYCIHAKALSEGKRLHRHIWHSRFRHNRLLGNLLVQMYGTCGSISHARAVFDGIREPNAFSRSMIIAAYACNGLVDDARMLFDKMIEPDVVTWNTMIAAYAQNARGKEALELFEQMNLEAVQPDEVTFISVINVCADLAMLEQGQRIHARIVESGFEANVVIGNTLIHLYGNCGKPDDAWHVFDKMPRRDIVSWNAMIAAFVQNEQGKMALGLFQQLKKEGIKPDKVTFLSLLEACACPADLVQGQAIHTSIDSSLRADVVVGTALVNMYSRCGSLYDAQAVFDSMHRRDVVAWTAMISAYSQNGHSKKALRLFKQMQMEGVKPDRVTFICAVDACASLAALAQGLDLHASIANYGLENDVVVATSLLNMYGKCGKPAEARRLFDIMPCHILISWNAMIAAYAQNGPCVEALNLFESMINEGVAPDAITFISILSACSHAGMLDDGWKILVSMSRDHRIEPQIEHYVCLIDLIGRACQLDEAEDLINHMAFQPDAITWMTFLGACKLCGDVGQGAWAAKHVNELDSKKSSLYVLLSHMYAATGEEEVK